MSSRSINGSISISLLLPLITSALLPSVNNTLDSGLQFEEGRGSPIRRFTSYGYTVAGVMLTFTCIIGTFAHLCVIIIIGKNQHLRTPVNWMLLNLSASKLQFGTLANGLDQTVISDGARFRCYWVEVSAT